MKAYASYKVTTKHVEYGTLWFFTYISEMLPSTAEIDISLKSSRNGGWHRLDCYPIRFSFHRWKRGKRAIWTYLCSVLHVFNGGKWNGLDSNLALAIRRSESFPVIYLSPLYVKAFARYKWDTKVFHFPRVSALPYNSQTLSCIAEIDISLESSRNGGWHRLGCCPIRSSFHRWKRGKRDIWSFLFRFPRV